jgi:prolyl-tRNA synthetase
MKQFFEKKEITKKSKDFSRWYNDVILKSELADYAPVKGCMVIRPYGFALWEAIQKTLDQMIKDSGTPNAYFPLFIPESFLKKEKEHLKGFSPELAVVTIGGGEELNENLVVRPTSETVMYSMFSKWISSWRDLPFKVNQWCNIVRWEKRTYLFLRTLEFLWQEGHTAHATEEEAIDEVLSRLKDYQTLYEDYLAMPAVCGKKSESEKFAGAKATYALEFLMADGKILQGCTSHNLGQNFARVFDVSFQDKKGHHQFVWQTSWGLTTRSIGGLIMTHGDDNGLILPPKIAPIQVVIVPILSAKPGQNSAIAEFCQKIDSELGKSGIRVKIDDREGQTVGWKFNEWELKGVPLRLEVGSQEVASGIVTGVRRDTNGKLKIKNEKLKSEINIILEEIQKDLYARAQKILAENTHDVMTYKEFKTIMGKERGLLRIFWCENDDCAAKIKEETHATPRVLSLKAKKENGRCLICGKRADFRWFFAQAY